MESMETAAPGVVRSQFGGADHVEATAWRLHGNLDGPSEQGAKPPRAEQGRERLCWRLERCEVSGSESEPANGEGIEVQTPP